MLTQHNYQNIVPRTGMPNHPGDACQPGIDPENRPARIVVIIPGKLN